jgi:hypothetical protein
MHSVGFLYFVCVRFPKHIPHSLSAREGLQYYSVASQRVTNTKYFAANMTDGQEPLGAVFNVSQHSFGHILHISNGAAFFCLLRVKIEDKTGILKPSEVPLLVKIKFVGQSL